MVKGDIVIVDNPECRSNKLTRFYGIVLEVTRKGSVLTELADGSVINRQGNSVAVFVQPPSNWQELYEQREVAFSHLRHSSLKFSAERS